MSSKGRSRSPIRRRDRERTTRYDEDDRRGPSSMSRRSEDSKRRLRDEYEDERLGERKRQRGSYRKDRDSPRSDRRRYDRNPERREERPRARSRSQERERRKDYDDGRYPDRMRDDRDRQEGPSSSRPSQPARDLPADPRARSPSPSRSASASAHAEVDKNLGKPVFTNSGLLAAATNTVQLTDGTSSVLKYNEPPEARKPTVGWRLYVFKGEEQSGETLFFNL